jgi:predicted PurR-regulated permease PerM
LSKGCAAWKQDGSSTEDSASDDRQETQVLIADKTADDWEKYGIRLLDAFCRLIAVVIVMGSAILFAMFLIYLLAGGALKIKDNWMAYQKGAAMWSAWFDTMRGKLVSRLKLSQTMDARVHMIYSSSLSRFQRTLEQLVDGIVAFATGSISFAVLVTLYAMFWLFQPLPISGHAGTLVQSYLGKKAFASFLYGSSVTILLFCLHVDLPIFFGLIAFCLHFVPEIGAFISMVVPMPLILLNGDLKHPLTCLIISGVGQLILKLIVNLLEMKLIYADDDLSLHPVWVLLSLNYFGFLWGPVGMLISVPLLAALKSIVVSQQEEMKTKQPFLSDIAGSILACLEGRKRQTEHRRSSCDSREYRHSSCELSKEEAEGSPRSSEIWDPTALTMTAPKKTRHSESKRSSQVSFASASPSNTDLDGQRIV